MKIDPTRIRIRAVVQAATAKATVSVVAFRASVLVPYIRIRTLLGQFFKFFQLTDTVGVSEDQAYFAEDYVEPGYVGAGFLINFTKVVSDLAALADAAALSASKDLSDTSTLADVVANSAGKGIIDTATASDSGFVVMQDYCDFTYFAEDYVGESRTFT